MLSKKEKPAKKQPKKVVKPKPTPVLCACGRPPVIAKTKGGPWIVTCAAVRGCTCNVTGRGKTQEAAVEAWNNGRLSKWKSGQ